MRKHLDFVFRSLVALALAGAVADVALFAVALSRLADGPEALGYQVLNVAVHVAIVESALVGVAAVAAAFARGEATRTIGFVLFLSAGFAGGIAVGMFLTGGLLVRLDGSSQPNDLASMLYAIRAIGMQLWPVPIVLSAAAALVWTSPVVRAAVARPARRLAAA